VTGVVSSGQTGSGDVIVYDSETAKPIGEPLRYSSTLAFAAFDHTGNRVVAACEKGPVTINSVRDPRSAVISLPQEGAWFAEFSPDDRLVLTTGGDGRLRVWDVRANRLAFECADRSWFTAFGRINSDNSKIVSVLRDGSICVWDIGDRRSLPTRVLALRPIAHTSEPPQFLPGTAVVTAHNAELVDLETGRSMQPPSIHDVEFTFCRLSGNGSSLICVGDNGRAYLLDVRSNKWLGEPLVAREPIKSVDIAPNGDRILMVSEGDVQILNVRGQAFSGSLAKKRGFYYAHWSPDGKIAALEGEADGAFIQFWDTTTGQLISQTEGLDIRAVLNPSNPFSTLNSVRFARDSKRVLAACGPYAALWDVATGKRVGDPLEHGYIVHSAQFSSDESTILTSSWDCTCRIWNAITHRPISQPLSHNILVNDATFSPDGRFIATASGVVFNRYAVPLEDSEKGYVEERYTDRAICVWDVQTGKLLNDPTPDKQRASFVEFSPDGHRLLTDAGNGRATDFPIFQSDASRKDIDLLALLAETVGGVRLTPTGLLDYSPCTAALPNCDEIQRRLRARPELNSEVRLFVNWFLADHSTRTISPYSKISVPEYIENRIKENTAESLVEAEQLAVGNPELLKRIELAKESLPPKSKRPIRETRKKKISSSAIDSVTA
jgi:WD40 repeat protein